MNTRPKFCFRSEVARSNLIVIFGLVLALLLGGAGVRAEQGIFSIQPNGKLLYYRYNSTGNGNWSARRIEIGTDWDFQKVFSGGNGEIFAIQNNGDIYFYRFLGEATGANEWDLPNGWLVGNGWRFTHVFSVGNGFVLAIDGAGDLFLYEFRDSKDGKYPWRIAGKKIDAGWNYRQVLGTADGGIFAIKADGDLLYLRFDELSGNTARWHVKDARVGNDWHFEHVFSGANNTLFAVTSSGDLLRYHYLGSKDGGYLWSADSGRIIDRGWQPKQVFGSLTDVTPRSSSRQLPPAKQVPLPAEPMPNARCRGYATEAVHQFNLAKDRPECWRPDRRQWQGNMQAHYDWCINASERERTEQSRIRQRVLNDCHPQRQLPPPVLRPSR